MPLVRVVEDHGDVAEWLLTLFTLEGVPAVATVTDFGTLLAPEPWEGVTHAVVDLMLPEVSGADVLRWLRSNRPDVRRVLFSAAAHYAAELPPDLYDRLILKASSDMPDVVAKVMAP